MRIAINALSATTGGGVTYLKNLIPRLSDMGKQHEYYVIIPKGTDNLSIKQLGANNITTIEIWTPNLAIRLLAEQLLLPLLLRKHNVDMLYSPGSMTSMLAPCKVVLLIQSIDMYKRIAGRPLRQRARLRVLSILSRLSLRKASAVIFLSDYARKLILQSVSVENTKRQFAVVHLGVDIDEWSGKQLEEPQLGDKDDSLSEAGEYMLSVSNIGQHKNYEVLIEAYKLLPAALINKYKLIIVGETQLSPIYYRQLCILVDAYGLKGRIAFVRGVSYPKIREYYWGASLFVLPSLLENFSFPILEAMASGVPVIGADSTAIPETMGDAGITFDPTNPKELAGGIEMVLQNQTLRHEMIRKGLARTRSLSWENTTRKTLTVFEEACEAKLSTLRNR